MKLRISGDSIRLRLSKAEAETIGRGELVRECTHIGAENLNYLLCVGDTEAVAAEFKSGVLTVTLPRETAKRWAESAEIGIHCEQSAGTGRFLTIAIEKDLECARDC